MTNKFLKVFTVIIVVSLLSSMAFMMFSSSEGDSATTDESTHIVSGYLANIDNDFNINTEHPFLGKRINTLPLLFMDVNLDRSAPYFSVKSDYYYDSWRESRNLGNDLLYKMGNNADKILRAVRTVPIILAIIFGFILFIIVFKIYSPTVAILTLIFYAFSPDILAHSRLVNTDLWVTVFYFLSIMSFGAYLTKPNIKRLFVAGLVFGLAMSVKFSSITLLPIFVVLWFVKNRLDNKKYLFQNIKKSFIHALIFFVLSWIVIWANYGFSTYIPPIYNQNIEENYYNKTLIKTEVIATHFIPSEFFKGIAILSSSSFGNRPAFLFGHQSQGGWWYYFPVAYAVKTPIPILLFLILSIVFYVRWRQKLCFNDYLLITPVLLYFIISMLQRLNIGIRHLLPIMPFIFIWISKFMVEFLDYLKKHIKAGLPLEALAKWGYMIFVTWYIFGTIRIYPHFLSYFNEFIGPKNGSNVLADSNIDWGQDIKRLKTWLDENKITEPILLEYFWDSENSISYYGINYKKLDWNDPSQKGYIAVGVSAVNNTWLKNYTPIAIIGYSINIYKIE